MRRFVRSAACALLALTTGCYSYLAVPPESVAPGTTVRARISPAEAERVQEVIGREARVLSGTVVESGPQRVLLAVSSTYSNGAVAQRLQQRLTLPRSEIVELETRRLDAWRTAGVVAAAAVVGGYIVSEAFGAEDAAPGGDRPGGDLIRIPVLSLPIR